MGFPVGYSDLLLPRLLLHVFFLLGYVRRFISWVFNAVGLGDLLDTDAPWPEPHHSPAASGHHHHHHYPEFRSVSAMLIQEVLPVVRYDDLAGAGLVVAGDCAVCLYEFEGTAEVRRLSNCRHVFHRCCLDRWIEHHQRSCPLCRAPLFTEDMMPDDDDYDGVWAAAGVPDSGDDVAAGEYSDLPPLVSSSSPAWFVAHHIGSSH